MLRRQFLEKVSGVAVGLGLPCLSLFGLSSQKLVAIDITFADESATFRREIEKYLSENIKQTYLKYCTSAHKSGALVDLGIQKSGRSWRIVHRTVDAKAGAEVLTELQRLSADLQRSGLGCDVKMLGALDDTRYARLGIKSQGNRLRIDYDLSKTFAFQAS